MTCDRGNLEGGSAPVALSVGDERATLSHYWRQISNGDGSFDLTRCSVLVADDDPSVGKMTRDLVKSSLHCNVELVPDGSAAIEALSERAFDVFIADMIMPGPSGLDLVKMVQERWPYTDIIVFSGEIESFPYVDVVRAGAKDFIAKPYALAEMEAKLLRVFRERALLGARIVAEHKYRSVFELNTNGMVFLSEATHQITDVNEAFCSLSGRDRDLLVSAPFAELLDTADRERFEQGLALCSTIQQGTLGDVIVVRPDGQEIFLDVSVTFVQAGVERTICLSFKDTTEKRLLEDRLVETAKTDPLTGLLNKRSFSMELEEAVGHVRTEGGVLCMIFLDVDNFKRCNDTYGHPVGDKVLKTIGKIIMGSIRRAQDSGFRFGGDEFAVLLVGADGKVGLRIGERIRSELEKGENFGASLSVGVAEYQAGMSSADFTKRADEALYRAKSQGRNTVCVA